MKIAIYHNLPSGGGKRALYEMTKRLAERHAIDVFSLSTSEHQFCDLRPFSDYYNVYRFDPAPLLGSPLGRLNQVIRLVDFLRLLKVQRRIAYEIDQGGYQVVFVHHCRFWQSPGLLRYLRTPSAYYCAEPPRFLYEPRMPRIYRQESRFHQGVDSIDIFLHLYRHIFKIQDVQNVRAATMVLVNSAFSRESLYRIYAINSRICYLGVDTDRFRPLNLPKDDFVLSVGACHPGKGFDFLIESLGWIVKSKRPRLILVSNFVDRQEQEYLQALARQKDVQLEMKVMISDDELVRLYNQARLTVYSPVMEPFGFVPIESMACGTPVIGVREGGVRESIQHEMTGLLTDRDAYQFAQAVQELLADHEKRGLYSNLARDYVQAKWDWNSCIRSLENRFESIIDNGERSV